MFSIWMYLIFFIPQKHLRFPAFFTLQTQVQDDALVDEAEADAGQ